MTASHVLTAAFLFAAVACLLVGCTSVCARVSAHLLSPQLGDDGLAFHPWQAPLDCVADIAEREELPLGEAPAYGASWALRCAADTRVVRWKRKTSRESP